MYRAGPNAPRPRKSPSCGELFVFAIAPRTDPPPVVEQLQFELGQNPDISIWPRHLMLAQSSNVVFQQDTDVVFCSGCHARRFRSDRAEVTRLDQYSNVRPRSRPTLSGSSDYLKGIIIQTPHHLDAALLAHHHDRSTSLARQNSLADRLPIICRP